MITCFECGKVFDKRKSLHAHIKAHGMNLGDYYVKNIPKYDLLTNEPIPFKNYENYSETDFRSKKNMYNWLRQCSREEKNHYCKKVFKTHIEKKKESMKYAPNHLYFMTHPRLPKKEFYEKEILNELFEELSLENVFTESISQCPNLFELSDDLKILKDTREQKPLSFNGLDSSFMKLDFGDYTIGGENYSYIYVDRKSEGDLKGTLSMGFERFCRELDRTRQFNAYLYIVIESSFRQIYMNNNLLYKKKQNLTYVWENMRKIIANYSDVCQFIFTENRDNSEVVIPYLLANGEKFKKIDLQFYLEKYKCLGN